MWAAAGKPPFEVFFQDSLFGQLSENPLQLTAAAVQVFRGFPDMDQKPVMAAILDIMQELVLKADEFGLIHCGQLYFFLQENGGYSGERQDPCQGQACFRPKKAPLPPYRFWLLQTVRGGSG